MASVSREGDKPNGGGEISSVADIERGELPPTNGSGSSAEKKTSADSGRAQRWRVLHRVPPHVRENKKHIYDPVVLALGPYHDHRQPQFRLVEEFKGEVLGFFCDDELKSFLCSKILKRVHEIRHYYGGVSEAEYDNQALAEMMLRDGCFLLYTLSMITDGAISGNYEKFSLYIDRLGESTHVFLVRDMDILENQIPLWVVKLLSSSIHQVDKVEAWGSLLCKYLSFVNSVDYELARDFLEDREHEPLHLLEAKRGIIVNEEKNTMTETTNSHCDWFCKSRWGKGKRKSLEFVDYPCPSVTELKAKGIHVGPSSNCKKDIRFVSSPFHGKLQLPTLFLNYKSKVFFSNVIAMEMSPQAVVDVVVTSYIDFMKSLVESTEDVKELRQKGILFSRFANDEEVVQMFKEIDTHGDYDDQVFRDVRIRIAEHCNSKGKTWMAKLTHTYFLSPWTAIALFAATFLLCLTFLQTYYAVNPKNSGN